MFRFTTNYETLFATQYAVAGGAKYAKISQLQKKGDPRIGIALCANTQIERDLPLLGSRYVDSVRTNHPYGVRKAAVRFLQHGHTRVGAAFTVHRLRS